MSDDIRAMPSAHAAEQALIGAVMRDPGAWAAVASRVSGPDFAAWEHRAIWEALAALAAERRPLDMVTVAERLERDGRLADAGGLPYVGSLASGPGVAANAAHYADAVRGKAMLRQVIATATEIQGRAWSSDPGELRDEAITALMALAIPGHSETVDIRSALRATMERLEADFVAEGLPGVRTGLATLDRLTGGWQRSDLILIGARPAVGKTALMLNFCLSAARDGKTVGIVSAEQPAGQLAQRLIALAGHIPAWKLRTPKALQDHEWKAVTVAVGELSKLAIQIFDASAPDMAAVRTAVAAFGADLVCVDYVQRLKGRGESSYDRVSYVAQGLKELARDFSVPVVALAQINRAGAAGAKMEHLKGSGDLEQEADLVAILERQDSAEVATLDLVKNRHGATGSLDMIFRAETMVFQEAERGYSQG